MAGKIATQQAPFDRRIRTLAMPMQNVKKQVKRGYLIQKNSLPGYRSGRDGRYAFNYLYNPSTIEAMYTVQTSGAALSYLYPNAGDNGDLAVPINQSVSWTVMYDRTYELNSGSYDSEGKLVSGSTAVPAPGGITADPRVYGVWSDVIQMQYFTGMMLQGGSAANAAGILENVSSGSKSFSFKANQGFMMMVPCWAFFGSQTNINYFGYISEWDVTYTHFTQFMVPMRCVMDITFNMLPPPAAKSKGSGRTAGYYTTPPVGTRIHG